MSDAFLEDIHGLHCHVCMEFLSTDPKSKLAPARTRCGHYVCLGCFDKLKMKKNDSDMSSYMCGICCDSFITSASNVSKGFTELIDHIRTRLSSNENQCEICERKHVMNIVEGFRCSRCDAHFSTEASGKNPPFTSFCGHSICVPCAESSQTKRGDNRFELVCKSCQYSFSSEKEKRDVAHGFMALIAEIQKKYVETQGKSRSEVKCESCNSWVHIDKARSCKTCYEHLDNLFPPICLQCALENHREINHHLVKYVSLKNVKDVMDSEEKAASVLRTYKTIREETSAIHEDEMNNMLNALNHVHNRAKLVSTSGECSIALNELQKQVENFEIASEEFVPAARTYSNRLQEVTSNLNKIFPKTKNQ